MPTITTLTPFAESAGTLAIGAGDVVNDTPPAGGSVADGDDGTWVQLGGYIDSSGNKHVESWAADFTSTGQPFALVLQVRLKTDADVFGAPPSPSLNDCPVRLGDTTGTDFGLIPNLRWTNVKSGTVASATTYTWGVLGDIETADPVDETTPSDAAGWIVFDPTSDIGTALTGDGLRFTFGCFWDGDDTNPDVRRAWIDLMEMRLIVATTSGYHPLRRFPRSDGLGIGPRRHYPLPSTGQRSLRRVGGTY